MFRFLASLFLILCWIGGAISVSHPIHANCAIEHSEHCPQNFFGHVGVFAISAIVFPIALGRQALSEETLRIVTPNHIEEQPEP